MAGCRSWAPAVAALTLLSACADDAVPMPADGGDASDASDASDDARDAALPDGPVTTTYEGAQPPRDGFCDAAGEVMVVDALPATLALDTRRSLVDHARPSTRCTIAGASLSPDFVVSYAPPGPGIFTMRTRASGTGGWLDTVLYLRTGCDGDGEELACNDDEGITTHTSRLSAEVGGGRPLFAIVDGFAEDDAGAFELVLDFIPTPTPSDPGRDTCDTAPELVFSGEGDTLIALATGDTTGGSSDHGCESVPSTWRLPDAFHGFTLDDVRDVTIRVTPASMWDVALYVLSACDAPDAVECSDTRPPGGEESVSLEALAPGRYIIGVDAFEQPRRADWEYGPYEIEVIATAP